MNRPNTWYKTSRQDVVPSTTPPAIYTAPEKHKQNPAVKKSRKGWKQHTR